MEKSKIKLPNLKDDPPQVPMTVIVPPMIRVTPPTAETSFFFKGFDSILEKYKDIDTEAEIKKGLEDLGAHLQLKKKPEESRYIALSPVSPEKAEEAASQYVSLVDATSAALIVGLIAAEAASLGQLDITLNNFFQHPIVRAALANAERIHGAIFSEGIWPAYRYKILKDYQPLRADADTIINLFVKGIIDFETFLDQIEYLGYDTDEAVKMANAALRYPDAETILELNRRGIVPDQDLYEWLRRTGLHPNAVDAFSRLKWRLPGYQDIISIYMREGYEPDKWVEIPQEFIDYMQQLGYSSEWAKRIWGKHWVLPSIDLLYEMYWKKIIDYDTLVKMLKYHDYEPVWRERLIQNAYRPIPRMDLRRAYRYGITDITELTSRYEQLGYKPEDAAKMAGIAVRESLDRYYTRLEQVARAAYRKGLLDQEGFTAILKQINTPEPAIALALEAEDLARAAQVREPAEEPPTLTVSQILSLYQKRIITREFASQRLQAMGYSSEDLALLLALYEPKPEPVEVNRELISAASQLYREGFMSREEFAAYLRKAGLNENEISLKIEAEDLRYRLDYLKDLVALAKEAYKKDVYTAEEMEAYLLYYGMQYERVKALSALEQLRKMPKPKEAG
jgi:hypothetical protein